MTIEIVSPLELSAADVAAWTALQGEGPLATPFLSPHWVQAVARAGGPDARRAKVAVVREGGEAKGFLAARAGAFTAMPIGAPMSDYQGLVAAEGVSLDPRALVRALGVQRLDFSALMLEAPALAGCVRGQAASHVIDLRAGYEAYVAERTAAGTDIFKDTAKKRRKLEREAGEVRFAAANLSQADFDQLIAWKRAQYAATGQTDVLAAGWTLNLLQQLFERRDTDLRGVLFTLHAGGKLAAAHYALCTPRIAHAWFIAHDDAIQRYSPGVILIDEVLRWAAARSMAELDLGLGDYRFKISLANRQRPIGHGFIGRPPATLVRAAHYQLSKTAEALPLGRLSALPAKAMRRLDLWRSLGGQPFAI